MGIENGSGIPHPDFDPGSVQIVRCRIQQIGRTGNRGVLIHGGTIQRLVITKIMQDRHAVARPFLAHGNAQCFRLGQYGGIADFFGLGHLGHHPGAFLLVA